MKPAPIAAAGLLAAFLLLSPVIASAATTYTISFTPFASTPYTSGNSISIAGSVSPAPPAGNALQLTIKNPAGTTVWTDAVAISSTGSFTDSAVAGGTASWTTGTYTVTASALSATGSATFVYNAPSGTGTVSGVSLVFQLYAATPDVAGQTVQVFGLVQWSNGTGAKATFAGHYHSPDGTPTPLNPATTLAAPGMYEWTIALPASAAPGGYAVHAQATVGTVSLWSQAGFTVVNATTSSGLPSSTVTTINNIASGVTAIQNTLTQIQSSLSSVSGGVTGLSTTLAGISSGLTALGNAGSQLTSLNSSVNNTQTYVLVVAALAVITLVLELAVLVRKLS